MYRVTFPYKVLNELIIFWIHVMISACRFDLLLNVDLHIAPYHLTDCSCGVLIARWHSYMVLQMAYLWNSPLANLITVLRSSVALRFASRAICR